VLRSRRSRRSTDPPALYACVSILPASTPCASTLFWATHAPPYQHAGPRSRRFPPTRAGRARDRAPVGPGVHGPSRHDSPRGCGGRYGPGQSPGWAGPRPPGSVAVSYHYTYVHTYIHTTIHPSIHPSIHRPPSCASP
jgi:hypothetical protein